MVIRSFGLLPPRFKMKFLLLIAAVVAAASAVSYEDVLVEEYNLYKAQYKKTYESPLENFRRLEMFLENKYEVAQHNLKYKNGEVTYEMEINEFSDWLPEELESRNGFNKDLRDRAAAGEDVVFPDLSELEAEDFEMPNSSAPYNVNWVEKGAVAPVKNQGSCGSCYAFSALGALETQWFLKTRKMVPLSEQQIVDCSGKFGNLGCNGGNSPNTYNYIKSAGGSNKGSAYPYEGRVGKCRYNKQNNAATVASYTKVSVSEEALRNAVAKVGPISVSINTLNSMNRYRGGVYSDPKCKNDIRSLNHAVLLVGYGTDSSTRQDYWLVKNSWGTSWGERGYIRMARNKGNMCGIATYAVYPRI